ncbi:MarR family winged helix-turn-helix transcriptional regulator [Labedaea rhizosphaerae]|uniref:MarR family transcriptional regulator n=1 Tax=Labedaea rhizosphaerae TaxID=598644 RepID=A0A4R6SNP1_LABRH|nr:MarR family winged helix-turn-helix transcriptional regulator [Labedaea rhizosphaerae]TDQ05200.1 MarR family transcriptional regulator [Labedaea rhizosphaerae]
MNPGPGQVLFEFVRHWARRAPDDQGRLVQVTEAVHTRARRGQSATVNDVAHELGIDQSGASRFAKAAAAAGYLEVRTSREDSRRRELVVTEAGLALLDQAHAWQERVFAELTEDWTDQQRADFQKAMTQLVERS